METYLAGLGNLDPIITGATAIMLGSLLSIVHLVYLFVTEAPDDGQD